ncbi:MAG: hypothetical protein AB7O38_01790 [Pirellulaceae bacterium]
METRVAKANAGDRSALVDARAIMDEFPGAEDYLGGDLAKAAVDRLLAAMVPKQLARQEAIRRRLATMAAELLGSRPTPLERVCVERICIAWLHSCHLDFLYAQSDERSKVEYLARMQGRANQRLALAIKSLGTVRKLLSPIQVDLNVAATVKDVYLRFPHRPVNGVSANSAVDSTRRDAPTALASTPAASADHCAVAVPRVDC